MQIEYKVLDKGIVKLIDFNGSDNFIAECARVSYGNGTKKVNDNKGLVRYLIRNNHTSPLEMGVFWFYVKVPISIARQWMRHRTGSFSSMNEISARYSEIKDEFYEPEIYRTQNDINKQGSSGHLEEYKNDKLKSLLNEIRKNVYNAYQYALSLNVSREMARFILGQDIYTEFVWKIDLHNLLHFLKLRLDEHAQYEIRVYAIAISKIVKELYPSIYEAFEDYQLYSISFSRVEQQILKGEKTIDCLGKSERVEFETKKQKIGLG